MPIVNVGGKDVTIPSVIIVGGQVRTDPVLDSVADRGVGTNHLLGMCVDGVPACRQHAVAEVSREFR